MFKTCKSLTSVRFNGVNPDLRIGSGIFTQDPSANPLKTIIVVGKYDPVLVTAFNIDPIKTNIIWEGASADPPTKIFTSADMNTYPPPTDLNKPYIIPEGFTNIADNLFKYTAGSVLVISYIQFPTTMRVIGDYAF